MQSLFIITLILVAALDAAIVKPLQPLIPSEDYTHSAIVDDDNPELYKVYWKLLGIDEIQFEIHAKTLGWVGLGISPNGGMAGSDIVIGWFKDGKAFLKDCYASVKGTPLIDEKQDYSLIEGAETGGYTILKFKRKLATCDKENDKEIEIGTQFMIFAWNPVDPVKGENDWQYHGSNRMQRTLMLLSFKDETLDTQALLPADTFTYSMTMENLKIPAQDTYYYCQTFEVPKFEKPVHMIQFEILFQKDTKRHYHHILVYECNDGIVLEKPLAQECGKVMLPQEINRHCMQKILVGWGIGGQANYTFPKAAGYRMDPTSKTNYFLIEMHYDNPELRDDLVDNSGVKLYFTETLRQHDLAVLLLGTDGNFLSLQIPPQTDEISFFGICYPECTERYLPEDGIYAVSALLHTHLAGRAVKTTLVRNDVAIQELFENPNYDFNYQFLMDIEPVKIKRGDALITTCKYSSMDRDNFTFFGFGTHDEMCYDFLYYYPKQTKFFGCMTLNNAHVLYEFYQSLMKDKLIPEIELNVDNFYEEQYMIMDFFKTKVKTTPELIKRFKQFFGNPHNKNLYCGDPNGDNIYKTNVTHYEPKENAIKVVDKCRLNGNGAQSVFANLILLVLGLMISFF